MRCILITHHIWAGEVALRSLRHCLEREPCVTWKLERNATTGIMVGHEVCHAFSEIPL